MARIRIELIADELVARRLRTLLRAATDLSLGMRGIGFRASARDGGRGSGASRS